MALFLFHVKCILSYYSLVHLCASVLMCCACVCAVLCEQLRQMLQSEVCLLLLFDEGTHELVCQVSYRVEELRDHVTTLCAFHWSKIFNTIGL